MAVCKELDKRKFSAFSAPSMFCKSPCLQEVVMVPNLSNVSYLGIALLRSEGAALEPLH